jgi:predicted ester cyclase
MEQTQKTKEFIIRYIDSFSKMPAPRKREQLAEFMDDNSLVEHILFFDSVFPGYELLIDEITVEDSRAVLLARFRGRHEGEFNGIAPTFKVIEMPLAVGYQVENGKIISHWLIADQVSILEQLGVSPSVTA